MKETLILVYSDIDLGLKMIRARGGHFIDSFSWAERTLACWAASFCLCDLPGFLFSYETPVDTMDIVTKPTITRCAGGFCTFHVNHSVIGLSVCSWSSSWLNSSIKEMLIGNWAVEINMSNELVLKDITKGSQSACQVWKTQSLQTETAKASQTTIFYCVMSMKENIASSDVLVLNLF